MEKVPDTLFYPQPLLLKEPLGIGRRWRYDRLAFLGVNLILCLSFCGCSSDSSVRVATITIPGGSLQIKSPLSLVEIKTKAKGLVLVDLSHPDAETVHVVVDASPVPNATSMWYAPAPDEVSVITIVNDREWVVMSDGDEGRAIYVQGEATVVVLVSGASNPQTLLLDVAEGVEVESEESL